MSAKPPRAHVLPIRVYYEDTDAQGVVYHANYLRFAERGRSEWLRELGTNHERLLDEHGIVFAARRCVIDYLAPARLDDLIEVRSTALEIGRTRLVMDQRILRGGEEIARIEVALVCVGRDGRAVRIPTGLRQAIAAAGVPETGRRG